MKPLLLDSGAIWQIEVPIENWIAALPVQAATAINEYVIDLPSLPDNASLHIPSAVVASWPEAASRQLGLPPNCSLAFDIRLNGVMGSPGAQVSVRWLQPGRPIPARDVAVYGPWLDYQGQKYRINSPVFDVMQLVDDFNRLEISSVEEQFRLWARIRETLGEDISGHLTDAFLKSFRVITASALTFSIKTDANGNVQLDPVLLTDNHDGSADSDNAKIRALTESDEELFPMRLDQLREGVPAFPLNNGLYVVADVPLQKALQAVRKLRQSDPQKRKQAAMYPEAVIRELMGVDDSEPTVFVETEKFAERVMDVGEWVPPILPWIKISPQQWGIPNEGGIRIGGKEVPLDSKIISQAILDIESAIAEGLPTITVEGETIAATLPNADAFKQLHNALNEWGMGSNSSGEKGIETKNVLIIETNLDETSYTRTSSGRRPGDKRPPFGLKTHPKQHQDTGLTWLQSHWIEGSRGAMLCDDMGLGKTFQALAFCLWLKELMDDGKLPHKPILIVAPVGLLRNWEAEINDHLNSPGLGDLVRAYGDHLKALKRGRHTDGTASLDTARLASANVVLANYEAVSDYQLSFGAVPFAAVVLDEAQKVKSPQARMTYAVKALNTEFMLAMTGTPVENRLSDLWCIADAVQPGALADLKDFSSRYEIEGADVQALRDRVWQDESTAHQHPKLLLRRLKTEKLDGLPEKHEHVIKMPMPARQCDAYQRALSMKEIRGASGTLGMIHAIRRASLHPSLLESGVNEGELRFEDSARFMASIEILDQIAATDEKVLIFLESLDLQDVNQLPLLLQRRYKLSKPPMVINGQVSAEARQDRVNRFQRESGFDIMLLSPKAGGVGLTLTAANHVIHLSRWWNPAVEDQCSDRVYRIGQTKPVHIYYPLAILPGAEEHSFDWQLQVLMDRKRKLAQNLLAAPAFTKEDYQSLVSGLSA